MSRILLTGVTGYIGKRLLLQLLERGDEVICVVRDKIRFDYPEIQNITVVEADFLDRESLATIPENIDIAYFLMHSMSSRERHFQDLEEQIAINFRNRMNTIHVKQVIYLSGMINQQNLSPHLRSRQKVEEILNQGNYHLTTLRAGIIIGSGSASFEIIRDLVEKLPIMIAPKWLKTHCQPIAIRDVLKLLVGVIDKEACYDQSFDIGGPDILTYKQMLLGYAQVRGLHRLILTVPVMTPHLSSFWLYFVTSVPYPLVRNLVDSMRVDFIARDNKLIQLLAIEPISYKEAVARAFDKIEQNEVLSGWRDALSNGTLAPRLEQYIEPPHQGCFTHVEKCSFIDQEAVVRQIWSIGGDTGWYYANFLWKIRGWMDRMIGGVGLRRSRTSQDTIHSGDALDFWRVIIANRAKGVLLLYAEMKLPGEAWLEFTITKDTITQTAIFRPRGIWGRLYWFILYPLHIFLFKGMIHKIVNKAENEKGKN